MGRRGLGRVAATLGGRDRLGRFGRGARHCGHAARARRLGRSASGNRRMARLVPRYSLSLGDADRAGHAARLGRPGARRRLRRQGADHSSPAGSGTCRADPWSVLRSCGGRSHRGRRGRDSLRCSRGGGRRSHRSGRPGDTTFRCIGRRGRSPDSACPRLTGSGGDLGRTDRQLGAAGHRGRALYAGAGPGTTYGCALGQLQAAGRGRAGGRRTCDRLHFDRNGRGGQRCALLGAGQGTGSGRRGFSTRRLLFDGGFSSRRDGRG